MITTGYSNITPWHSPRELAEDELAERIEAMYAEVEDPENLVAVLHPPPYGTELDQAPMIDGEFKVQTERRRREDRAGRLDRRARLHPRGASRCSACTGTCTSHRARSGSGARSASTPAPSTRPASLNCAIVTLTGERAGVPVHHRMTLEQEVTDERTLRTAAAAEACGADWAILTAADSVYYAAQVDTVIETGMSAFAGGPLTAIVGRDGTLGVVATNIDEAAARASAADHVTVYRGLELHDRTLVEARFRRRDGRGAVRARRRRHRRGAGRDAAVDGRPSCSRERGAELVEIDAELTRQRMTKTALEIERLRWCAHLTDLGQAAALRGVAAGPHGARDLGRRALAMEAEEGTRVPVAGDSRPASTGPRRSAAGPPTASSRTATRSCATSRRARTATGATRATRSSSASRSGRLRALYRATEAAVQAAVEHLRPGITMGELDTLLRDAVFERGATNIIHNGPRHRHRRARVAARRPGRGDRDPRGHGPDARAGRVRARRRRRAARVDVPRDRHRQRGAQRLPARAGARSARGPHDHDGRSPHADPVAEGARIAQAARATRGSSSGSSAASASRCGARAPRRRR